MEYKADIQKKTRHFLPEDYTISNWENLEPYFKNLSERGIDSRVDLENWLQDMSELESVVSEDSCWRQIKMTCDTENKQLEESFTFFVMEIQPKIQPYADLLNRKLLANPFTKELDQQKFFTYLRGVKNSIEIFREANIPLQAELGVMG